MSESPCILIVATSHDALGDTGKATGAHFSELAGPYYALLDAGFAVDLASPLGGEVPIDPGSRKPDGENAESVERFLNDEAAMAALRESVRLADVDPERYAGVYLPGGHGTMWDLPHSAPLARLVGRFFDAGKVVGAVCHGPAGLIAAERGDGRPVVEGRRVNAFTDAEERKVELDRVVPFLLESRLTELGARFEGTEPFGEHAVRDGNLVTGQNPASVSKLSRLMLEALSEANAGTAA